MRSVLAFSLPAWFTFVVNLASAVIITRHLNPDAYGLVNTFQASSTLLTFLFCVGLDNGFLRYFHETPAGFDKHRLLVVSMVGPLVVLLCACVVVLPFFSTHVARLFFAVDDGVLTTLLGVSVATGIVTRLLSVHYRMEGDSWLYGTFSVSLQVALKGSMIAAALLRPDYFTVIGASVLGVGAVVVAFLSWHARPLFPAGTLSRGGDLRELRGFLSYSVYTWPVPVLIYLQIVLTQIIVRWRIDNDAVGLLTSVSVFVGVVSAFQAGFATFWSGYMYRNYRTQVGRIKRMHDYLAIFAIMSMAGFVLFREQVFLLLGVDYHPTKPFFALLLVSPLLLILSETTAYGVGIAKKSHVLLLVTTASVGANVGMTWGLTPDLGLLGACAGSVVSGVVLFTGQTYFGQKYFSSIERPSRTAFAVAALLALALVNLLWSDNSPMRIGLSLGCVAMVVGVYRRAVSEVVKAARQVVQTAG